MPRPTQWMPPPEPPGPPPPPHLSHGVGWGPPLPPHVMTHEGLSHVSGQLVEVLRVLSEIKALLEGLARPSRARDDVRPAAPGARMREPMRKRRPERT